MKREHIVIDARIRQSSTGRYADRLLNHIQTLDTKKYRFTVLVKPDDPWRPIVNNFSVLKCKYKLYSFNPLQQVLFAVWLYKLKADLIHFTMTPQDPMLYFGRQITTTHDLTMLRFSKPGRLPVFVHELRMIGYRFLMWQAHRKSKRIIAISEYVKKDIISLHPFVKSKITTILEASEPPLTVASEPLTGVKKPFIMHVGSPFPHKNIERLIEAFFILKETHLDLQLVLAGKKEYYFNLLEQSLENNKYKNDIIIPGFVSDAQLKWLYENTEAYVLPSLSEGFGLPGLEAMAHGAPVASSNATCLPEVYETAAAYFNPLDIRHIAVVIEDIIGNVPYANKLRTRGKKRITCFSWQKMAKETLSVYESVL